MARGNVISVEEGTHRTFLGPRIVDLLYGLVVQGGAMFLAQVHFWGPFEGNLVWFLHGITYSCSTNEIYLANQIGLLLL